MHTLSIGRVVWFYNLPTDDRSKPLVALITAITSPSLVSAWVINADGTTVLKTSVEFEVNTTDVHAGAYARFPDYAGAGSHAQGYPGYHGGQNYGASGSQGGYTLALIPISGGFGGNSPALHNQGAAYPHNQGTPAPYNQGVPSSAPYNQGVPTPYTQGAPTPAQLAASAQAGYPAQPSVTPLTPNPVAPAQNQNDLTWLHSEITRLTAQVASMQGYGSSPVAAPVAAPVSSPAQAAQIAAAQAARLSPKA